MPPPPWCYLENGFKNKWDYLKIGMLLKNL